MATPFAFDHHLAFTPAEAETLLRAVPAAPGIFALRGQDPAAEPYLSRTADLRRRMRRLLAPPEAFDQQGQPVLSRRLNLRDRIGSIAWTRTGSEFESTLLLYRATSSAFGAAEARRRLRLYTPFFLRVTLQNAYPRAYVTNKLSRRSLAESFGPFPSRAAAERYCDAVLDLFQLRRCYEDLEPHPDHPGCAYGEMNKCRQPCKGAAVCPPDDYAAETTRVFDFFRTRGQSLLDSISHDREAASEAMDFEAAASHHKLWERARAASLLADELVRPVEQLRAVILQPTAPQDAESPADSTPAAAVFLLERGHVCGPRRLSTLGVRAVREQTAVGSSLFAQPLMLAAVPLAAGPSDEPSHAPGTSAPAAALSPEDRARSVLVELESQTTAPAELSELCDALSLFRRWYYRPEKQRTGECFLPNTAVSHKDLDRREPDRREPDRKELDRKDPGSDWPVRRILNGAARIALGPPVAASPLNREAAREATREVAKASKDGNALKTRVLHAGRKDIERTVPVLPPAPRPIVSQTTSSPASQPLAKAPPPTDPSPHS